MAGMCNSWSVLERFTLIGSASHRIAAKKAPPKAVTDTWPKDLSSSIALKGNSAVKTHVRTKLQFEALTSSGLNTRSLLVATDDHPQAELSIDDTPRSVVVEDMAKADTTIFPEGTMDSGTTPTWNARIRVKK